MILTVVFALGLPIWLVVEEIVRLRGERLAEQPAFQMTPTRAKTTRATKPIGVALTRRSA